MQPKTIKHAGDLYLYDIRPGDQFIYRGRTYTRFDCSGTIAKDYETVTVFTNGGGKKVVKLPLESR